MTDFNSLSNNIAYRSLKPYQLIKDLPMGYIDIGARGGAHGLVEPLASHTAVLGFEPDEEEYQRMLADSSITAPWANFDLEAIALADVVSEATLHLLSAPTNHSLLPPNEGFTNRYNMPKWRLVGTCPLKTELLDTILFGKRANETHWGEFMKLDTQGTEFEILQGAKRTLLDRTVALVTEVAFCELYKGQKQFSEIELFLREHGFAFYGFHSMHSRSQRQLDKLNEIGMERAMYADAVFLKDPLPGTPFKGKLTDRQIFILFSCALMLKYYDFALELAKNTWAAGNADELALVRSLISTLANKPYADTQREVIQLAERVKQNPEMANVYSGKFSDSRRLYFDYDDVSL